MQLKELFRGYMNHRTINAPGTQEFTRQCSVQHIIRRIHANLCTVEEGNGTGHGTQGNHNYLTEVSFWTKERAVKNLTKPVPQAKSKAGKKSTESRSKVRSQASALEALAGLSAQGILSPRCERNTQQSFPVFPKAVTLGDHKQT